LIVARRLIYLAAFMGYVDIHCHLLWGIDDGCRTPDEAVEAARALVGAGFSDAAPSPHTRPEFASADRLLCESRLVDLQAVLAREGIPLKTHAGAENYLDDSFMERVSRGEPRGLGESERHVLVELPFQSQVPTVLDLVFRLKVKGISPIFAHPERCAEFEREGRASEVVRLGAALQLDLGALLGRYGRAARKLAERFLGEGLYALAATDLHSPEGALGWIADALLELEKRAGAASVRRLCEENPRCALAGEELS
jgi:protein-tyrosine phosphatase